RFTLPDSLSENLREWKQASENRASGAPGERPATQEGRGQSMVQPGGAVGRAASTSTPSPGRLPTNRELRIGDIPPNINVPQRPVERIDSGDSRLNQAVALVREQYDTIPLGDVARIARRVNVSPERLLELARSQPNR
ncbi:MAG: hypothetical protein ACK5PF_05325, partial [bacterium]